MIKIHFTLIFFASLCLIACSPKSSQEDTLSENLEEEETPAVPITVTAMPSEGFPDAMVELYRPLGNETFPPGKVPFEFNIKNFPFGQERPLMMAVNGGDPQAYPQAVFSKEFNSGTYRVVAFLTDDKGFAIKEFGNFVDRDFLVGQSRPFPAGDEPYLMVNFPRQAQEYLQGEPIIVDFLVVGGDLKLDGMEVEVRIGEFIYRATNTDALKVQNLSVGEYDVRIDLIKNDGSALSNIFASASRRVAVK